MNAALSERARALQEQVEQIDKQCEMAIGNCPTEHQVTIERMHQDIARLTQRNDRLQAQHIRTVVASKEQQCVNQAAQDPLAQAIQAEREARDQLRLSIEHHRVA
uniref:Uncharacterized protein n=1 Tax=Peronospora matthiolae TaxID=2874970 RepID=A0AAV1UQH7_9STRA